MEKTVNTVAKGLSFSGVCEDSNMVLVDYKDNKLIRIRPFPYDWKYDRKPWSFSARGQTFTASNKSLIPPYTLGYKNRVNSPNRVMYPLKRVDWDPNGERNPQNRGKSKYERITWDEATDIIAAELRRVVDTYGPTAVFAQADGHGETKLVHASHGCCCSLLNLLGGFTLQSRNTDSWEGWYWGAKHVWGCEPVGKARYQSNILPDICEHTKMMIFAGCDPETTPWGWGGQLVSQLCYWFTELGIKQVYVCPDVNYGAAVHADKWIPILPNTDAALHLAIAYYWIINDTYEKEYVDTHVIGFDQFKAYVLGEEDGIPKTPQWASEKTGIPSRIIKALARAWASMPTSTAHANGGNMVRSPYATENARLEVCLLGMQGLGMPGRHMWTTIEWGLMGEGWTPVWSFGKSVCVPRHARYPSVAEASRGSGPNAVEEGDFISNALQFIPKTRVAQAILEATHENPMTWYGTGHCLQLTENQFVKYQYPKPGRSVVRMIWTDTPSLMSCWNDSNYIAKAYQSPQIEFMLAQHPWIENDCLFADIILPVATKFELDDIGSDPFTAEYGTVFLDPKCIEKKGESRSDYEVVCAIAEKMGLLEELTHGKSIEDYIKLGFDTCGIDDLVTWEEFREKGHFVIPNDPDWDKNEVALRGFAEDPENNPLSTPTGKLEFFSQRLAEHFPDDDERPPIPKWIEKGESHDERIGGERAKLYPYLVISNHPRWRVHSQHDDMKWLREINTCKVTGPDGYAYEPGWINPKEAGKLGVRHGDVMEVYNDRGSVLVGAFVTERIMPGVIYVDHGARYDPIIPGLLDRGGAINTITPRKNTSKNATGMVSGGFLAGVKRADLEALRREHPDVFSAPYCKKSGLVRERMMAD